MPQESPTRNIVLIVIAIIGVGGTIVASAIGAVTNYKIEQQRQVFELTRVALVSIVTQSGVTQAALQSIVDSPTSTLYPTQTPQPTHTLLPLALPTSTCPLNPDHLGAGRNFVVTLREGCHYHFNVACPGCSANVENNYIVYYKGDSGSEISVTVPEGSVWRYDREPNTSEVCEAQDFYPTDLPQFLSMSGIQLLKICD